MPGPFSSLISPILDDRPATEDALDFAPYRDMFVDIVCDENTHTPLTVGLFGSWGSGKTSLMSMIKKKIDDMGLPAYRTTWFNAWKYNHEDVLWRALIVHVLNAMRPRNTDGSPLPEEQLTSEQKEMVKDLDRLEESLYHAVEWEELGRWTLDWAKALRGTAEGAAEIALSLVPGGQPLVDLLNKATKAATGKEKQAVLEAFQREVRTHRREQLQSLEQFEHEFQKLLELYVTQRGGRLIVFVDDLDRCLPEKTIDVLEAIKLFLDVPGCIFLLGLDQEAITQIIQSRYSGTVKAEQYLEKIVQIPFILPPIEAVRMRSFIASLVRQLPDDRCGDVFAEGLPPSPRQVKRIVNIFLLLWRLARQKSEGIQPVRLAKVVAIQHTYPALYALVREVPRYLRELEVYFRADIATRSDIAAETPSLPTQLQSFEGNAILRRLLTMHPASTPDVNFADLTPEEIHPYIYLTYRATTQAETPPLPAGFQVPEMVVIPAGKFTLGSAATDKDAFAGEKPAHEVELNEYAIGRYPVTNFEYRAFVQDAKHKPPSDWEGDLYPEGKGDHPVTYVSWHDAVAYCEWLSQRTGQHYRPPTEAEWEKAARGEEGFKWPWGDEWDPTRCNSKEGGIRHTTSVGQFSTQGSSPHGVADMAGNVWEWCSSLHRNYKYRPDDGREDLSAGGERVVRGGGFLDGQRMVRCASRNGRLPNSRDEAISFRIVKAA